MLRLWAVEVVHRGVQPREDGWGDVERQLLVEESLLLGLQHEHLVIHGRVAAARFRVHCQVLEVGHSWKEGRQMADAAAWHNPPITPAQKLAAAMCPCPGLLGELLSAQCGAGCRGHGGRS